MILSNNREFDFDIIHFNSGLWDILRLSNEEECFNSPEQYKELLERIVQRIRYFYPKAKLIFALSTKVKEPGYIYGSEVGVRKNADIEKYNQIAVELFEKLGEIEINNLWKISIELGDEMSDSAHYNTPIGEKALGGEVSRVIRNMCNKL